MAAMNLRGNLYRGPDRFSSNSWTNDRKQLKLATETLAVHADTVHE
jgi:hypothetical protein